MSVNVVIFCQDLLNKFYLDTSNTHTDGQEVEVCDYRFEGLVAAGLRHVEDLELSWHHSSWVFQQLEVWLSLFLLLLLLLLILLLLLTLLDLL